MTAARHYAKVQGNTASKERLMVMLFETALGHMRAAARDLDEKNVRAALPRLDKASKIVLHLQATLKREAAPKLVDDLNEIYTFTAARITRAIATSDAADVREAERAFAPIVEGFAKAVAAAAGANSTAAAATGAAARP